MVNEYSAVLMAILGIVDGKTEGDHAARQDLCHGGYPARCPVVFGLTFSCLEAGSRQLTGPEGTRVVLASHNAWRTGFAIAHFEENVIDADCVAKAIERDIRIEPIES